MNSTKTSGEHTPKPPVASEIRGGTVHSTHPSHVYWCHPSPRPVRRGSRASRPRARGTYWGAVRMGAPMVHLTAPNGIEAPLQFNYSSSEGSPGGASPGAPRVRGWQFHIGCIPQVPRPRPPGSLVPSPAITIAPPLLWHTESTSSGYDDPYPAAPWARRHGTMRAC